MNTTCWRTTLALTLVAALGVGVAQAKKTKPYPTATCVSQKQKSAAAYCKRALAAWATWEKSQDDAKRDGALANAESSLASSWDKAETKAAKDGVDCAETTGSAGDMAALIDSAVGAIVDDVNAGLDLGDKKQAGCGQKILKSAAGACAALLKGEGKLLKQLAKPGARDTKDANASKTSDKLVGKVDAIVAKGCPTQATGVSTAAGVQGLVDAAVLRSTNSPNVDASQFETISPSGSVDYQDRTFTAQCMDGSPYVYFARRGSVNKLLVYYQGGGACWDYTTCHAPTCDTTSTIADDDPNHTMSGFGDASNPANPFRDWNVVFVSYCGCDIHFGDAAQDYVDPNNSANTIHVEHRGYQNARVVEKWTREHFVNPDEVFVTGSSAGAYGAWFNGPLLHDVWPASRFYVLADAGNGVVTQDFLETNFPHWNFDANLPPDIPELKEVLDNGEGIPGYTEVVANEFPDVLWAHYASAFDGGSGGQTGFYNLMLQNSLAGAIFWWQGSCQWNDVMRQQAIATAAAVPSNYRYYIGTGSRHTMWGSNKVYTDTSGGVPLIVDWVEAMLASAPGAPAPGWTNVECTDCGVLLPGDPRPNPLQEPFAQIGPDTVVVCPSSPAAAFLDGEATTGECVG